MVSLALFLAAFGPLSTRYGFPSGNSLTAPIDATATVTPVSCENALFPPPHLRVCGLRVCGFCRPLMRRRPSLLFRWLCRRPMRTFFSFRVFPAAPCDAGLSLPSRRHAFLAFSSARSWATRNFASCRHRDCTCSFVLRLQAWRRAPLDYVRRSLPCGVPARTTGDHRRGPLLCHAPR